MGESVEVSVQPCQEEVISFCSTSWKTGITLYLCERNWYRSFVSVRALFDADFNCTLCVLRNQYGRSSCFIYIYIYILVYYIKKTIYAIVSLNRVMYINIIEPSSRWLREIEIKYFIFIYTYMTFLSFQVVQWYWLLSRFKILMWLRKKTCIFYDVWIY